MVTKIWKLAAILAVITLYTLVNAPNLWTQTDVTTSSQGVTFHTDVTIQSNPDNTSGTNMVNPTAKLDTSQIDDTRIRTIIAEDGSRVTPSYYNHVKGASKAMCRYLGKSRVKDPVYGHRCVAKPYTRKAN
jgi:hypothetical protein